MPLQLALDLNRCGATSVGNARCNPSARYPQVDNSIFVTDVRKAELARVLAERAVADAGGAAPPIVHAPCAAEPPEGRHDTVGAVAIDAGGSTAAATSTGGMAGKWPGRVGDSPLVGCGSFADDLCGGAVSTTGTGELIARFMLAREVAGEAAGEAAAAPGSAGGGSDDEDARAAAAIAGALRRMAARGLDGPGVAGAGHGVILVTPRGGVGVGHSSERMSWAAVTGWAGGGAPETVSAGVLRRGGGGDGDYVKVHPTA